MRKRIAFLFIGHNYLKQFSFKIILPVVWFMSARCFITRSLSTWFIQWRFAYLGDGPDNEPMLALFIRHLRETSLNVDEIYINWWSKDIFKCHLPRDRQLIQTSTCYIFISIIISKFGRLWQQPFKDISRHMIMTLFFLQMSYTGESIIK